MLVSGRVGFKLLVHGPLAKKFGQIFDSFFKVEVVFL